MATTPFWPNRSNWCGCCFRSSFNLSGPSIKEGCFLQETLFFALVSKPVWGKGGMRLWGTIARMAGPEVVFSGSNDKGHKPAARAAPQTDSKGPHSASSRADYAFLVQLRLSRGAGLSIILPTPQWKPWYRLPVTPVLNRRLETVVLSARECLNIVLHFGNSQEH
jgi:hypothetical protein